MKKLAKAFAGVTAGLATAAVLSVAGAPAAFATSSVNPNCDAHVSLSFTEGPTKHHDTEVGLFDGVTIRPGSNGEAVVCVTNASGVPGFVVATLLDAEIDEVGNDRAFQDIHLGTYGTQHNLGGRARANDVWINALDLTADHAAIHYSEIDPGATIAIPVTYRFDTADPYLSHLRVDEAGNLLLDEAGNLVPRTLQASLHLHKIGIEEARAIIDHRNVTVPGGFRAVTGGEATGTTLWPFALAGGVVALGIFAAKTMRDRDQQDAPQSL